MKNLEQHIHESVHESVHESILGDHDLNGITDAAQHRADIQKLFVHILKKSINRNNFYFYHYNKRDYDKRDYKKMDQYSSTYHEYSFNIKPRSKNEFIDIESIINNIMHMLDSSKVIDKKEYHTDIYHYKYPQESRERHSGILWDSPHKGKGDIVFKAYAEKNAVSFNFQSDQPKYLYYFEITISDAYINNDIDKLLRSYE